MTLAIAALAAGCESAVLDDDLDVIDRPLSAIAAFEGETMTSSSTSIKAFKDSNASGGQALAYFNTGSATKQVSVPAAATSLLVRARGQLCSGAPDLVVKINGTQVMAVSVSSTLYTDYTATLSLPAGEHTVSVIFPNDFYQSSTCDRNLFLDKVTFGADSTTPPPPTSTPPPSDHFEAESMSAVQGNLAVYGDSQASGGKALVYWSAGEASKQVSLSTPSSQVVVRGRGQQCNGSPQMVVKVDGVQVLSTSLPQNTYSDFSAPVSLSSGVHTVSITFANDAYQAGVCDRNLFVDKVSFIQGACTPATCAGLSKNCGSVPDGCGGTLSCGACTSPQACGGGGSPNVCGTCTPTTCAAQGANCGSLADGCGGTLSCGTCASPESCGGGGKANVCGASTGLAPPANFKVAFVGDTDTSSAFTSVLNLIKSESAQAVVMLGDMSYADNPSAWYSQVDGVLGASFPVFLVPGNHDAPTWGTYASTYKARLSNLGVTPDDPNLNDEMYSFVYRNLSLVVVGQNGNNSAFASFINSKLTGSPHIWKICAWHKNQNAMQVGSKTDEMGWEVYENCRKLGAIVATGHEHSYERTRTLTSMSSQTVDSSCSDAQTNCVSPGRTFAFVSGLGGRSIRNQDRCLPTSFPYGCKGEWAKIYASDQGATWGVTFITFNTNGDPRRASGYYKAVNGQVIDQFTITAQ